MSDKTCAKFHEARMDFVGAVIKFIRVAEEDEREIDQEIQEAVDEAKSN